MRILLTGATGYIGKRLLPVLVEQGHQVVCLVRDKQRFQPPKSLAHSIEAVEADLLDAASLAAIPTNIDAAYYLVHSMATSANYAELEKRCAQHFRAAVEATNAHHVLYLGGIANEDSLSKHLQSRQTVEEELRTGGYHFTALRAGIIIGSGSASFEIIRDLVEKLPVMVAPKWLNTRCQPIGIADVVALLSRAVGNAATFDGTFDIAGPDVLTYKQMLLGFAKARGLKRSILTVPVMTPRLSSYWLYFVTSTSYKLAVALVNSMKVEVVARDNALPELLDVQPMSYREALAKAFAKIENNAIVSSWKDAYASSDLQSHVSELITVPSYGCFKDKRTHPVQKRSDALDRIWRLGGSTGWYYGNFLWQIRGMLDKLVGGVGLRRGRTNPTTIQPGDALDFWRVLYADKEEGRLLLFAEMKLPGDAWLEFRIENEHLTQTATFRPLGVWGRLYWFAVWPFHGFIFSGLISRLAAGNAASN